MLGIKGYIWGFIILGCLMALAIVARNWSCRKPRPPRPPVSHTYMVVSVPNGATILVNVGRGDRRTAPVTLQDIAAPVDGADAEASRANLERLAGKQIRVEIERRGLLRGTAEEENEVEQLMAARKPIVGVAYGESGGCLNLSQIMEGWATCQSTAEKAWKKEEKTAKKAKAGMWGKK
jgi:endonuclease YncB( thermonuclease family)